MTNAGARCIIELEGRRFGLLTALDRTQRMPLVPFAVARPNARQKRAVTFTCLLVAAPSVGRSFERAPSFQGRERKEQT